jgi:hypothetical protein
MSDEINEEIPVEDLFDTLRRQILELAISSDNPQFKLDAYKATVERGKAAKPTEPTPVDVMGQFRSRVAKAESGPNGAE